VNPAIVIVDFSPDVYKIPNSCIGCHDEPTLIAEGQTRRYVDYAKLCADTLPLLRISTGSSNQPAGSRANVSLPCSQAKR
jgi:hypothetical protein